MDEETNENPFVPKENTSLSPSIKVKHRYGSTARESEEEEQPLVTNITNNMPSSARAYIAVAVLCYVNLLNYMDRYTIAGKGSSSISTPYEEPKSS